MAGPAPKAGSARLAAVQIFALQVAQCCMRLQNIPQAQSHALLVTAGQGGCDLGLHKCRGRGGKAAGCVCSLAMTGNLLRCTQTILLSIDACVVTTQSTSVTSFPLEIVCHQYAAVGQSAGVELNVFPLGKYGVAYGYSPVLVAAESYLQCVSDMPCRYSRAVNFQ